MKLKNRNINEALDLLEEAEERLKKEIVFAQKYCSHEDIVEDDGGPSYRMCLHCGLSEIGWGIGFIVLHNKEPRLGLRSIARSDILKLRQGPILGEKEKSQLMKKEKQLIQILEKWYHEH